MSRCPNCGTQVYGRVGNRENLICSSCGARLRISVSRGVGPYALFFLFPYALFFLLIWLFALPVTWGFGFFWLFIFFCCLPAMRRRVEVVQLSTQTVQQTSSDRNERARSATTLIRQSILNRQPDFVRSHPASRYCSYCGAAVPMPDWRFCKNCGASLSTETAEAPHLSERNTLRGNDHARRCMVCGLNLSGDGSVACCPHCGNTAHRTHLLEWLHIKKYCPVCGQHLTELEIE
nr:zinc ribbon domain-containing protein [Candidatus Njordarchaeota archaeon]